MRRRSLAHWDGLMFSLLRIDWRSAGSPKRVTVSFLPSIRLMTAGKPRAFKNSVWRLRCWAVASFCESTPAQMSVHWRGLSRLLPVKLTRRESPTVSSFSLIWCSAFQMCVWSFTRNSACSASEGLPACCLVTFSFPSARCSSSTRNTTALAANSEKSS